jgi:hypothetical protein
LRLGILPRILYKILGIYTDFLSVLTRVISGKNIACLSPIAITENRLIDNANQFIDLFLRIHFGSAPQNAVVDG